MTPNQLRAFSLALFFLFIFLSGLRLNQSGRSYSTILLTIHKLISLGAGLYISVAIYRRIQVEPLITIELLAVAITGLLFVGTIISGGLLSTGKKMPAYILRLHQITPILTVFTTAVTLFLLLSEPSYHVVY